MILGRKGKKSPYYSRKYNPPHESPPVFKTLLVLFLLAISLIGIDLFAGTRYLATEGPLSFSHALLENKCNTCHAEGFQNSRQTMQAKCVECHSESKQFKSHATSHKRDNNAKRETREVFCVDCHQEHRGRAFKPMKIGDTTCQNCHKVFSLDRDHPEFKPAKLEPVNIQGIGLRFDHTSHRKNEKNSAKMNAKLEKGCPLCHQLDPEKQYLDWSPIRFDTHCQDCHPLEELSIAKMFEAEELESMAQTIDRLVEKFNMEDGPSFLSRLEYVKGNKRRRRPDSFKYQPVHKDPHLKMWFTSRGYSVATVENILNQGRSGTTLNCLKCHVRDESETGANAREDLKVTNAFSFLPVLEKKGEAAVTRFSHKKHAPQGCKECHENVESSKSLVDANTTAQKKFCFTCHTSGVVRNDCTMCHGFHKAVKPEERSRLLMAQQN